MAQYSDHDEAGMPVLRPGCMVRTKAFTSYLDGDNIQLQYKRPRGKNTKGKYFVFLLMGVDDGVGEEGELDPDEWLKASGWTHPDVEGPDVGSDRSD